MENNWEKPYEDDGVTLGPEDALRREIEKIKALKVEKLQLKDTLEKLRIKNDALVKTNRVLDQKLNSLTNQLEGKANSYNIKNYATVQSGQTLNKGWSFFILAFNLAALGILLILFLKQ